ncbi:unnamed protein product [Allacma fusca]|uniref:Cell division cycle protein 123 homolog n=1 Tax=Allacma fusca TaxID=39272 RepID=A0A8J2PAD6_9HEXA|nr:unnamed protein product [Allacma fusca]
MSTEPVVTSTASVNSGQARGLVLNSNLRNWCRKLVASLVIPCPAYTRIATSGQDALKSLCRRHTLIIGSSQTWTLFGINLRIGLQMAEFEEVEDVCDYYSLSENDLTETSLPNWYKHFSDVTIKTMFLKIPSDVLEYLRSDSMRLPLNTESSSFKECHSSNESLESMEHPVSDDLVRPRFDDSESDDENLIETSAKVVFEKFEDFDSQIKRTIETLGGSAFPKINWKCPKDAMWIAFNRSLRSYLPGDIYLIMKSSTNVYSVLHEPYKDCGNHDGITCEYYLCLRRWTDLDPATEFRCFVLGSRLICISQRETSGGYEKIPAQRDAIIQDIHDFFRLRVHGKFALDSYVFDVARVKPGKVVLIDFGVFGLPTDPLLFTYREIKMMSQEMDTRLEQQDSIFLKDASLYGDPHFRFIGEHGSIYPITSRKLT